MLFRSLKNAISLTNNYIVETHGDTGMFATIFFGILDVKSGALTYINAGHLPPLVSNKHGIRETLPTSGPAVGAVHNTDYTIKKIKFEQGDMLFTVWTDGIRDTISPDGKLFDIKDLTPLLTGRHPLESILEQIFERVTTHADGAKQFDDIAMIAVKRQH